MKINLKELKIICEILTDRAQNGFEEVELNSDNYWFISSDEREVFDTDTPSLCVGSISDDIESLRKVIDRKNPPTPVDFNVSVKPTPHFRRNIFMR